jgi:predicted naringenin-chalcone synthase
MVWRIGNHGFSLRLSPRVPNHLAEAAPAAVAALFDGARPQFWAIHPGGNTIVNNLAARLGLDEAQIAASRTVLRNYGNLSSATILFVLAELQKRLAAEFELQTQADPAGSTNNNREGVAMAFGPGLVVEMARIGYVSPVRSMFAAYAQSAQLLAEL